MNILDIGIILILLMFIVVGFKLGVIRELFSLVGIIVIFYISYLFKGIIGNLLCLVFPFFKFTGSIEGISSINILMYQVIAFILVFAILLSLYMIIIKVSKTLQKIINLTIILWLPSKLLGGVVGFIKGIIILFVVLIFLMIPIGDSDIYKESNLKDRIIYDVPLLSKSASKFTTSIKEIYLLEKRIKNNEISKNEANIKSIDIMLKNKVIDRKLIEKLIEKKKLDNIKGVEKVLNNY